VIEWERAGDDRLEWRRQGSGEPTTPLDESHAPYYMQSWSHVYRRQGTPETVRYRYVEGRRYVCWRVEPPDSWAERDRRWRAAERALPERWRREWLPEIQADLARLAAVDLDGLADDDLGRALQDALAVQTRHWILHVSAFTAVLAVQRLVDWYLRRFPEAPESEPYALVQGLSNLSVEHGHRLWALARTATPPILAALRASRLDDLPTEFAGAFRAYLEEFGQRVHEGVGLAGPTWLEDPGPAIALLLGYVDEGIPDPLAQLAPLSARRAELTAEVRARLSAAEAAELDDLLAVALAAVPITEDHAHWIDQRSTAALQRVCRAFGRRLLARGAIDEQGDLAFLMLDELLAWAFGRAEPLRARVAERRARHEVRRRVEPPEVLGARPAEGQGGEWVDRFSGPSEPAPAGPGEVRGVGASPGVRVGPARVAASLAEAGALRAGEVLVCPATSPDFAPLFGIAAALVTDSGGSLCHAAVVAREYGLPAVVGTRVASRVIRSGQVVEVDGTAGVVRIVG
jgi:pyruvate,water dikinase